VQNECGTLQLFLRALNFCKILQGLGDFAKSTFLGCFTGLSPLSSGVPLGASASAAAGGWLHASTQLCPGDASFLEKLEFPLEAVCGSSSININLLTK